MQVHYGKDISSNRADMHFSDTEAQNTSMEFYHFNIFARILTPLDIIAALPEPGDRSLIKVQMISTILQVKNDEATIFQTTRTQIINITKRNKQKRKYKLIDYHIFFSIRPFNAAP